MSSTYESVETAAALTPFASSLDQLEAELRWLALRLRIVVARGRRQRAIGPADDYRGLYVSDEEVDELLDHGASEVGDDATLVRAADEQRAELDGRSEASAAVGTWLPLDHVTRTFGLDAVERGILTIALAPHIDQRYEKVFAYANDDITRKRPTVGLAIDMLAPDRRTALQLQASFRPSARLLRHRLITVDAEQGSAAPSLLSSSIQVDPHVVSRLLAEDEANAVDPRLKGVAALEPGVAAHGEPGDMGQRIARLLRDRGTAITIYLGGRWSAEKRVAAAVACEALGLRVLRVHAEALDAEGLREILPILVRDARMLGAAILVTPWDSVRVSERDALGQAFEQALADHPLPLFLSGDSSRAPGRRPLPDLVLTIDEPDYVTRRGHWAAALGDRATASDLDQVAATFRLGADAIAAAAEMALTITAWEHNGAMSLSTLRTAARLQSQPRLSDVAQRIEARFTWDDIVIPADRVTQLQEISMQVLHRHVVYEDWGFGRKSTRGRGISALFVGDSGTGKTMAAEVIGYELGMDVYKIDLAGLVSKYIGETEKNLSRVFDEAEGANAILFFDEADAVFGKRTEVRDSHDRYANIEVSYLLQKMEEYDGIVILSSNLRANLDEAFLRRLTSIVEFPFPDEDDRRRIWELNLTSKAPLDDDIDLDFMAKRIRVTGGNIKNIATLAAFLAAEEGSAIAMRHLIHATRREYQKLGRLVTESDFAHWYGETQPSEQLADLEPARPPGAGD